MIYVAVIAGLWIVFGFWRRVGSSGLISTVLDILAAGTLGWIAGLLIGFGARLGMWLIPVFNGGTPRITFDGTVQVVITFALFGIGLGILYELLFRDLLRRRSVLFGLLITAVSAYPLTESGVQQLTFAPSPLAVVFFGTLVTAAMFVPFSIVFEFFISRWHGFRSTHGHVSSPVIKS